jgi:NAD+ synthetase
MTVSLRLALSRFNSTVGDLSANAAAILRECVAAATANAHAVVFPELAICGYPPKDLLWQEGFVKACETACADLARQAPKDLTLIIGSPAHMNGAIRNALLVYRDGSLLASYAKRLLPTYDVFDEDRYFTPGTRPVVVDVPANGGIARVGLSICEDLWQGADAGFTSRYATAPSPVQELVQAGAQVILSPSASPYVLTKGHKHRAIVQSHAIQQRVPVVSLNQLGANDELIFDGHAIAFDRNGHTTLDAPLFQSGLISIDVPIHSETASAHHTPVAPLGRDQELRNLYDALVLGVRDYLRKTGFKSALLGLSGGIDSALTAVLGCAAIGPANMLGVAMPSKYSSDHSKGDAYDLAERLGMRCVTVPIESGFQSVGSMADACFDALQQPRLGASLPDLTEENLQSRIRGTTLMALSNRTGAVVLTTGNKSEMAVGYCTLYGDMNGGLAVLCDVSKMLVYELSRYINTNHAALGFARPPIPENTITKAPSAELRPNQTDQDSLPPYEVLDEIIERAVELRQSAATIVRENAGKQGFDEATVKRIIRLISIAEYKRKQAAIGLKVTSVAFGSGRRWPIAQRWNG